MSHFPTSPVLSMVNILNVPWDVTTSCKRGVGPQKPNNLKGKHKAKLAFPEGWEFGTEKTSMERVDNDRKKNC